jgi:hypothetical protein
LRGIKTDLYEGGIRVPMIVRWPGKVPAGVTSDQIWAFWDFLPTAAEIAGTDPPKGIDGVSVLPALLGKSNIEHPLLYWEYYDVVFEQQGPMLRGFEQAARVGDWKAIRPAYWRSHQTDSPNASARGKALELYNLKNDLGEKADVAASNPELIQKMEECLRKARSPYLDRPELEAKVRATDNAESRVADAEIGTVIKFDQASEKYRVSGWNKSEGDYAWSKGKTAKLSMRVPTNVGPLTVTMTMHGLVQPPTIPVQPVELYVNGKKIANWQVTTTAPFTAEIPAELTRGQDNLNFELRIPHATSPKVLGMNDDERILGVCVSSIELKHS